MPLKKLTDIDAQILKLREEITAQQVPAEKFAQLDKLIAERIALIKSLSGDLRREADQRPKP